MTYELGDHFERGYLLDWYDGPTLLVARRRSGEPVSIKRIADEGGFALFVVQQCSEEFYSCYVQGYGVAPEALEEYIQPMPDDGIAIPCSDEELFSFDRTGELLIFSVARQQPLWETITPTELSGCIGLRADAIQGVLERMGLVQIAAEVARRHQLNEAWRLHYEQEHRADAD